MSAIRSSKSVHTGYHEELLRSVLSSEPYTQDIIRRMAYNIQLQFSSERLGIINIDFNDLGYNPKSKMGQLQKNYFNDDQVSRAKEILHGRTIKGRGCTSVGFHTQGSSKRKDSQGHCIQAITVNYFQPKKQEPLCYVDVFYRTTEITRAFGADIMFFKTVVIPEVLEDIPLTKLNIHLSSASFSPTFLPQAFLLSGIKKTMTIVQNFPRYHHHCKMEISSMLNKDNNWAPRVKAKDLLLNRVFKLCPQEEVEWLIAETQFYWGNKK